MSVPTQAGPGAGFTRGISLDSHGHARTNLSVADVDAAVASGKGCLWIDLDLGAPGQAELLKQIHGLHPLSVDDALSRKQRPKVEEYNDYLFIVILGVRFHEQTPDPYDLETFDICFFLGNHFLITAHAGPSDAVDDVAERLQKNPELLSRGVDRLAHAIMDGAVDEYFPLLDKIDELIDDLEQRVIVKFEESALQDIFAVKRLTLSLRRHLAPEREVFNILTNRPSKLLSPDSQIYFRDIYDHVIRLTDELDNYRELASATLDVYLTQVNNNLSVIMKRLTGVTVILAGIGAIAGIFGMSEAGLALGGGEAGGFWAVTLIVIGLATVAAAVLRRIDWI